MLDHILFSLWRQKDISSLMAHKKKKVFSDVTVTRQPKTGKNLQIIWSCECIAFVSEFLISEFN